MKNHKDPLWSAVYYCILHIHYCRKVRGLLIHTTLVYGQMDKNVSVFGISTLNKNKHFKNKEGHFPRKTATVEV